MKYHELILWLSLGAACFKEHALVNIDSWLNLC